MLSLTHWCLREASVLCIHRLPASSLICNFIKNQWITTHLLNDAKLCKSAEGEHTYTHAYVQRAQPFRLLISINGARVAPQYPPALQDRFLLELHEAHAFKRTLGWTFTENSYWQILPFWKMVLRYGDRTGKRIALIREAADVNVLQWSQF